MVKQQLSHKYLKNRLLTEIVQGNHQNVQTSSNSTLSTDHPPSCVSVHPQKDGEARVTWEHDTTGAHSKGRSPQHVRTCTAEGSVVQ